MDLEVLLINGFSPTCQVEINILIFHSTLIFNIGDALETSSVSFTKK